MDRRGIDALHREAHERDTIFVRFSIRFSMWRIGDGAEVNDPIESTKSTTNQLVGLLFQSRMYLVVLVEFLRT
jgi:hypothetical protein